YQWFKDDGLIQGATGRTLVIPGSKIADSGSYYVKVISQWPSFPPVQSQAVTVTVLAPPRILEDLTNQIVKLGEVANFSIEVQGTPPLKFEWFKDDDQLPTQETSSLSVTAAHYSDAGEFWAVVRNSEGSVTSRVSTLTVCPTEPGRILVSYPSSP